MAIKVESATTPLFRLRGILCLGVLAALISSLAYGVHNVHAVGYKSSVKTPRKSWSRIHPAFNLAHAASVPKRNLGAETTREMNRSYRISSIGTPARSLASSLSVTSFSPTTSANPVGSVQETSDQLLNLLQRKAKQKSSDDDLDNKINVLVRSLIDSRSPFNPQTSINGPLFATIHFNGETPLWEKISIGGVRNVKGQKYTISGDNEAVAGANGGSSGKFVNYAEILGENLYLKAVGRSKDNGPVTIESTPKQQTLSKANPFDALTSLFFNADNGRSKNRGDALLPTPYDYEATVTGASIVLLQQFSLDLSIEGTGTVRVLYADENLRIFLSPTDTNVTRGGGDWESQGLVVVQVRVDLVYDDWVDKL